MDIELKSYLVAFIDLLGFSYMVTHDCEAPNGDRKFIESLLECHQETKKIKEFHPDLQLIQFSDAVVFALPYSVDNYLNLIEIISDYQYNLLKRKILCRGGISYGKHFFTEDFLFSNGLIEAYRLESQSAIYPRVVVGNELLELVMPSLANKRVNISLTLEQDGLSFINYLSDRDATEAWEIISQLVPLEYSENSSIRAKQIWLLDYYNHLFPHAVHIINSRFS